MKEEAIAKWFYSAVQKAAADDSLPDEARTLSLFNLFRKMLLERTQGDRLYFSTLFARMAYAFQRYQFQHPLPSYLHRWRRFIQNPAPGKKSLDFDQQLLLPILAHSIHRFYGIAIPTEMPEEWGQPLPRPEREGHIVSFQKTLKVVVLDRDAVNQELIAAPDLQTDTRIRIRYNIPDRNEHFSRNLKDLGSCFAFPVSIQLIDVEIDQDGVYRPAAFVIEPDFLLDVTAIAECFKDKRTNPPLFLLNKFLPIRVNKYLLTGHLANYFLDELLADPNIPFTELLPRVFRLNPIGFSLLSDMEIREIRGWALRHYQTLREMALRGFREEQIEPDKCSLEPTFFSMEYGIQGRLDVFYREGAESVIVELKSGKPFRANTFGLSDNHYVQTLLYDLLIRSAFGEKSDPKKYILYSGQQLTPLRYAPRSVAQQHEALEVRNTLISLERRMANTYANDPEAPLEESSAARLFQRLQKRHLSYFNGFAERDLLRFEEAYRHLSPLEQKYFIAYVGFIAREHRLAKTGDDQKDGVNGQARLWLNGAEEKEESFGILRHLEVTENRASEEEPQLVFQRVPGKTNALANFRVGDIGILYPYGKHPLRHQLFKCIILKINAEQVVVRLRSRSFTNTLFEEIRIWNLEPDLIDSSFTGMYRSLFSLAESAPGRRQLFLGLTPPAAPDHLPSVDRPGMTTEQNKILEKLLAAPDYFLLWGPPGTGKTSVMLRETVGWILSNTEERMLLLAYTNRAVDEICASIESLGPELRSMYCRIGSRYSTSPDFRSQLLEEKIQDVKTRAGLVERLQAHRIYVGTLASWMGKQDLQELLSFDRVIIDEASQILEPMLSGLLPRFPRFVLIGDHQQLPAVVTQSPEESLVVDTDLNAVGLTNMRNSLFERLYLRALENNWDWAYDQLRYQGRMHHDIMSFPNQHFYQGNLFILPEGIASRQRQQAPLPWAGGSIPEPDLQGILHQRFLFYSVALDTRSDARKTSRPEAEMAVRLVKTYLDLFAQLDRPIHEQTLGIITPYRAQIALIRDLLQAEGLAPDQFTIDTVERYQGGARDIILLSLCTNSLDQLHALVSLSDDGVDRKLNVALTRAREQIIVLGNPEILDENPTYRALMEHGTRD